MSEASLPRMQCTERGVFTLLILGFDLLLVVACLDYPYRARLAPLAVGIPTAGLLIYQALLDWFPHMGGKNGTPGEVLIGESSLTPAGSAEAEGLHWREFSIALWLVVLLAGTTLLGILATMPLFAFAYLRFWARESWLLSLIYAVFLWASIYALLVEVLNAQLPVPLLIEWLGR